MRHKVIEQKDDEEMQKDETAHKKKDKGDRRAEDDEMFLSIKMPSEGL